MKRLLFAFVSLLTAVGLGDVVKDIAYDASLGEKGVGDLYRPDGWTAETPVVLQIHGGGWTALDRASWAGVAKYFTEKLGYACYNIEYRLAPENPWPAGGEDCIKAANYLLSSAFATTYGLRPKQIWICGGSAGGHLALWTGLSLPADKVAGIISISGIGNPRPDATAHPDRYKAVFGNREPTEDDFASIDLRNLLKAGAIPKILQTHVDNDSSVPIQSARDFAARITELGGTSTFVEYKKADVTTTGGHCIWVPKSNPHELIPTVKSAIEAFLPKCGEISLTNRFGSARIETLGARVTSYVPAGGEETLALLASGTGGIPLCWPWFQFNGPHGETSPKHGVARYHEFEVVSVANGPDASEAVLRLRSDAQTRRDFPHDFELTLTVRLDQNLNLALRGKNTGTDAFSVTEAFHPYLLRPAIPLLMDTGNGRYRTWEPDRTSHTKTQGLGPEDWRKFVCVENGTFKKEEAYTLAPGESHTLTRTLGPMQRVNPNEPLDTSIQAEIDAWPQPVSWANNQEGYRPRVLVSRRSWVTNRFVL